MQRQAGQLFVVQDKLEVCLVRSDALSTDLHHARPGFQFHQGLQKMARKTLKCRSKMGLEAMLMLKEAFPLPLRENGEAETWEEMWPGCWANRLLPSKAT